MSEEQKKTNREKLFQGVGKSIENSEKVMNPIFGRLRLFKQYQPADANDWQRVRLRKLRNHKNHSKHE